MWNREKFIKALKTIKAIRTKRVDGVPYYKVNIYHPVIWVFYVFFISKDIAEQIKSRSNEFRWLLDYGQQLDDMKKQELKDKNDEQNS